MLNRIMELNSLIMPVPTEVNARLLRLDGVKVVLFDIYGTLLTCGSGDVGSGLTDSDDAADIALAAAGCDPLNERAGRRASEFLRHWIDEDHKIRKEDGTEYPEVDIREIWMHVLLDLKREGLIDESVELSGVAGIKLSERLAVEYECRVNPAWPMPEAKQIIKKLNEKGLRLGLVSNAQFYTPLLFEAFLPEEWRLFDKRLSVFSYELREAKPSQRLVQKALDVLFDNYGCLPSETLFVGNDMLNDIAAAANAGCRTALFAGDAKSLRMRVGEPRCAGIYPDIVLKCLSELTDAL